MPRGSKVALILAACSVLAACSGVTDSTRRFASSMAPYKVEIVQGNFVSKEQVEALKPGMAKQQVRDILGTPLLQSVFHADRWDYVFTLRRQGIEPQARQLTVYFANDRLERVEGDPMPSESEFVGLLGQGRKMGKVPELQASEDSLKPYAKAAAADAAAEAAKPPVTDDAPRAAASYPPLESPAR
jgi:outer membrane protein assembly factor BamE